MTIDSSTPSALRSAPLWAAAFEFVGTVILALSFQITEVPFVKVVGKSVVVVNADYPFATRIGWGLLALGFFITAVRHWPAAKKATAG